MAEQKRPNEQKPSSTMELYDLCRAIEQGESIELAAAILGRAIEDVQRKAEELNIIQHAKTE
jgi:hypothetical protein